MPGVRALAVTRPVAYAGIAIISCWSPACGIVRHPNGRIPREPGASALATEATGTSRPIGNGELPGTADTDGSIGPVPAPGERESNLLPPVLNDREWAVIVEMNRVRKDPSGYAGTLEDYRPYYRGELLEVPGRTPVLTEEGRSALEEAILALRAADPAPPLAVSRGLSLAAKDHAEDLGVTGRVSHEGSDGSDVMLRLSRYGTVFRAAGENIMFGEDGGGLVTVKLLIDDGVPERGHRRNILDPDFRVAGVACRPHPRFRSVCVITFAGAYDDAVVPADGPSRPGPQPDPGGDADRVRGSPRQGGL